MDGHAVKRSGVSDDEDESRGTVNDESAVTAADKDDGQTGMHAWLGVRYYCTSCR